MLVKGSAKVSAVYLHFTVRSDFSCDASICQLSSTSLIAFGNLCRQTKIHNIGATLVGVDKFGNKYYEKTENTQYG
jgi:hypothetical protein